jgi:hypothetical protein
MAHEDKYGINRRGVFMRQCTFAATGIAFAVLLSSAPAMAQANNAAYNTDRIGWNRGGEFKTDTVGKEAQCFKGSTGKFDGPQLTGTSDAATHGWQNYWGPCVGAAPAAKPSRQAARH